MNQNSFPKLGMNDPQFHRQGMNIGSFPRPGLVNSSFHGPGMNNNSFPRPGVNNVSFPRFGMNNSSSFSGPVMDNTSFSRAGVNSSSFSGSIFPPQSGKDNSLSHPRLNNANCGTRSVQSFNSHPRPGFQGCDVFSHSFSNNGPPFPESVRNSGFSLGPGSSNNGVFSGPASSNNGVFSGPGSNNSQRFQQPGLNNNGIFPRSVLNNNPTFPRPRFNNNGIFSSPGVNNNATFPRPGLNNNSMFPRPGLNNKVFPKPGLNNNGMCPRPVVNNNGIYPRPGVNNNGIFPRPGLNNNGIFPRPGLNNNCFPGAGSNNNGSFLRPGFNNNGMFFRPRFSAPGFINRGILPGQGLKNMSPFVNLASHIQQLISQIQIPNCAINPGQKNANRRPIAFKTFLKTRNVKPFPRKSSVAAQQNTEKLKPRKVKSKRQQLLSKLKFDRRTLKPWMTDELYIKVQKRYELYVKAKLSQSTAAWDEFKLVRNKVGALIKDAKVKAGFLDSREKQVEDDGKDRPFACDTCNRAYETDSELADHLKEHCKCEVNGCKFEAHHRVVALHQKMQHDTGYAEIISKLDDDAEIEKWRTERKRRFPTMENVEKHKAMQEEKISRGEVLETKEFGKFKKPGMCGRQSRNGQRLRGQAFQRGRVAKYKKLAASNSALATTACINISDDDDDDDDSHIALHKFPGMSASSDEASAEMSQSRDHCSPDSSQDCEKAQSDSTTILEKEESPNVSALSKMQDPVLENRGPNPPFQKPNESTEQICENEVLKTWDEEISAESKSQEENVQLGDINNLKENEIMESEDEGPVSEPLVKEIEATCVATNFSEGTSEESKNESSHKSLRNVPRSKERRYTKRSSSPKSKNQNREFQRTPENSLLEKLLATEIRHERNIILQCIRYTVNNNFFGVAGNRTSKN